MGTNRMPFNMKRTLFFSAAFIVLVLLVRSIFYNFDYVKDCLFSLAMIMLFFFVEKKYPLNSFIVFLGLIPMVLNPLSLNLHFWGFSFLGIQYDKWIHLLFSFLLTIVLFYIMISRSEKSSNTDKIKKIIFAGLIILAVGAVSETSEFIGMRYLHFYGPTMFSQGNDLSDSTSDTNILLDTQWDSIFNIIGVILASILLLIISHSSRTVTDRKKS